MKTNELTAFLERAIKIQAASDIFIVPMLPPSMRVNNLMVRDSDNKLLPADTQETITEIYKLAGRHMENLLRNGDDDFSFSLPGLSRFRVSAYKQRGTLSAVIRVIPFGLPDHTVLGIPDNIMALDRIKKGLVLVTGPAGSGKSTTLACMIDDINSNEEKHIITLEDPLEFLHRHNKSIVSQREINVDTDSYATALRAALRQSPDVILLGEMRDYETIQIAMTAAETGHLVFSTLHTLGSANAIDRIIDVFPPAQQGQIRMQLSMVLQAVVSQQLVPTVDGKLTPAFELMTVTPDISTMIRDNKIHLVNGKEAISMDNDLLKLYQEGKITKEVALRHAVNESELSEKIARNDSSASQPSETSEPEGSNRRGIFAKKR
ncbi:MAG: PilT/PilU family type 4a pilus ATPase [Lachnospiraceae bacterium]|jgi:twitching motility protein PilT|nr:PilT/PilU family type 4a pilus ATPase [Lachnospiraceae bacterium]MDE7057813.1 PilT/PilU family type 4a pilus ATPase [Lachnospiraceae bacterium]